MSAYEEDEFLFLSGIQHMAFCERQWALIHIEQAWSENVRTIEGKYIHERSDNPFDNETRNDVRVVRGMPVISHRLGLRGIADVVEFHRMAEATEGLTVRLTGRQGWWQPYPVEYKRGRPKVDNRDAVQLCAQGIALEEMLKVSIESGFLYYAQTKRRLDVFFDQQLRCQVEDLSRKMYQLFLEGKTPKAEKGKHCSLCSLEEICQPRFTIRNRSVGQYIERMVDLKVEDK